MGNTPTMSASGGSHNRIYCVSKLFFIGFGAMIDSRRGRKSQNQSLSAGFHGARAARPPGWFRHGAGRAWRASGSDADLLCCDVRWFPGARPLISRAVRDSTAREPRALHVGFVTARDAPGGRPARTPIYFPSKSLTRRWLPQSITTARSPAAAMRKGRFKGVSKPSPA